MRTIFKRKFETRLTVRNHFETVFRAVWSRVNFLYLSHVCTDNIGNI